MMCSYPFIMHMLKFALKRLAAPKCASRTPCSAAPSHRAPVFDFRAHFCHSAPMETHAFGFRLRAKAPEGPKAISYQFHGGVPHAPGTRQHAVRRIPDRLATPNGRNTCLLQRIPYRWSLP
jgi:hypothetical protein